jgi:hypothetical protein
LRKCSTSWDAYRYLQDRVHDSWLPDSPRQRARQIIKKIRVQVNQRHEHGWTYETVKCLPPEITAVLWRLSPSDKTEHAMIERVHGKSTKKRGRKR